MNRLQKKKLEAAMKRCGKAVCEAAKILDRCVTESLKAMKEILDAENALAAVANDDLVHALRPIAQELAEWTEKRYVDILDQARGMILEGKEIPDVLYHFDRMLFDLKEG